MSETAAWIIAAGLGAIFIAVNGLNLWLVFGGRLPERESRVSPVYFLGGMAGTLALLVVPIDGARDYWVVPLLVDLGSAPLLLLTSTLLVFESLNVRTFLRRVPFLRYLAPEPANGPWPRQVAVTGCILGTAVGDAMGLACEGLGRARQRRLFGAAVRYRVLFGKGLVSDDTEHTCMVAQALIETAGWPADEAVTRFPANLAWRLRGWLLLLPAGVGFATLRAILKLWVGFPARRSGVRSAGNGPAMRVAIIGVACADDAERARRLTVAATRITHTHPEAEQGALAIMLAARLAATAGRDLRPEEFLAAYLALTGARGEMVDAVRGACDSVVRGECAADFAEAIGCGDGVSGWIRHTVPAVLQVWLTHQTDYRRAIEVMVGLGGDTDTTAAIAGALVGARLGPEGIPPEWLRDLWEWPRSVAWMFRLGERLARHSALESTGSALPVSRVGLAARNLMFIPLVLAHGLRRLFPPY